MIICQSALDMKKNVLQLTGSFHQGGSERQAVQLSRLLHKDDRVNLFVATLNREGVLRSEIDALGLDEIPEFRLNSFYGPNFIKQLGRSVIFLRTNRIDVIHTHDFYTNVFGMAAARLAGVKLRIASKRETGGMRSDAQDRVERFAFGRAHRIVVNSLAVRDYLIERGVEAEKPALIYNGLDLDRLVPESADPRDIRESLGIPVDGKLITLVANLRHAVKNQPMFLRAAARAIRDFPDARFVLAGEGELQAELESLANRLGIAENVHFIGRCTRVPDLLAASFAGVLTSFNEGFSNSILEYMAAGLPVVATNVGGAAEAIVEGETGSLIDSDDDEALAAKLGELLADEAKARAFGAQGRMLVRERFSIGKQLSETLELYGI